MKKQHLLLLSFGLFTASCSSGPQAPEIPTFSVTSDEYTGDSLLRGSFIENEGGFAAGMGGRPHVRYRLAAVKKTGSNEVPKVGAMATIVGIGSNVGWTFPQSAFVLGGRQLELETSSKLSGTIEYENTSMELSNTILTVGKEKGLQIKIIGRNHDLYLKYPPEYVREFCERLKSL